MKFKAPNRQNLSIKSNFALPFLLIIFVLIFTLFEDGKYPKWTKKYQYPNEFISISKSIYFLSHIKQNENFSTNYFIKKRTEQRLFVPPCIFSLIKQSCFRYKNIIFIGLNYFFDISFRLYSRSPPRARF